MCKCEQPCKRLHKMDRNLKRLIWKKEAIRTTKAIMKYREEKLKLKNELKENPEKFKGTIYYQRKNIYIKNLEGHHNFLEQPINFSNDDTFIEIPCDHHSFCKKENGKETIGIIKARKF